MFNKKKFLATLAYGLNTYTDKEIDELVPEIN